MARSKRYYEKYSIPPLKLQFERGYKAFKEKKQWLKKLYNGKTIIVTSNPYPHYTMQAKEWERGYNKAYFENMNEHRTRG
jgi:hypothetical protein|tara:strand:+ start:1284 stop:1523 length:240 start_codon:yes stop_codon:yes gene_type:complete